MTDKQYFYLSVKSSDFKQLIYQKFNHPGKTQIYSIIYTKKYTFVKSKMGCLNTTG